MKNVDIVLSEYNKFMYGRFRSDGDKSAEAFREDVLKPAMVKNDMVTLDISMKYGLARSALEEIFGGLVRHSDFSAEEVLSRLNIISDCEFTKDSAVRFIKYAGKRK